MARVGDIGPYSPNNVVCISHSANVTDAARNDKIAFGEETGNAVLSQDAVLDIYTSDKTVDYLAHFYEISIGTINDTRSRRTWRRVTARCNRVSLRGRNQWA